MIVAEKEEFELAIKDAFEYFYQSSESDSLKHDEATQLAYDDFNASVKEAEATINEVVAQAIEQFNNFLAETKTAIDGALSEATKAIEARLAERLAAWNEQKDYKLK